MFQFILERAGESVARILLRYLFDGYLRGVLITINGYFGQPRSLLDVAQLQPFIEEVVEVFSFRLIAKDVFNADNSSGLSLQALVGALEFFRLGNG
jgi:hypothetical protein